MFPNTMTQLTKLQKIDISGTPFKYLSKNLLAAPALKRVVATGCSSLLLQNTEDFRKKVRWDTAQSVYYPNNSYYRHNFVFREYIQSQKS